MIMAELHVYKLDCGGDYEWYIAESAEDARAAWIENCGEDDQPESIELVDDSELIGMGFWELEDVPEHCRGIAESITSVGYNVTLTAGEWSKREPRGFLCATEF